MPVPVRFLKLPFQVGMQEGVDYEIVRLSPGDTLYDVVNDRTGGDLERNLTMLLEFNEIRRNQASRLSVGTPILVPNDISGASLEPTTVSVGDDLSVKVVHKAPPTRREELLEERLEMPKDVIVNERSLGVLKYTNMPAVLIEAFNIQNDRQRNFYSDNHLQQLAEQYVEGVVHYRQSENPGLEKVIIDVGHGLKDPGAVHRASGATERDYSTKLHNYMAAALQREGFQVKQLNYAGRPSPIQRVRSYTREANAFGTSRDSVYIVVHIDSLNSRLEPVPRVFVHNDGRQVKSSALARSMLGCAVPWYRQQRGF